METKSEFTIEEIKDYLMGKRLTLWNGREHIVAGDVNNSLNNAIIELQDREDGIEAVTKRNHPKPTGDNANER